MRSTGCNLDVRVLKSTGTGQYWKISVRNNNWYGLNFKIDVGKRSRHGSIAEILYVNVTGTD